MENNAEKTARPIKVSVILPIYNVEAYLKTALDSLLNQTLKEIEIICVNDGSTDGSGAILDEYASISGRIIILCKENGGQSSARNAGLKIAQGKYLYFMDSDDFIDPPALEQLYQSAEENRLDILYFSGVSFSDDIEVQEHFKAEKIYFSAQEVSGENVLSGQEFFRRMETSSFFNVSVCLQLIRHEFLNQNALSFKEGIIHEDELFSTQATLLSERSQLMNKPFFHRRVRADSTMTKRYSRKNAEGYFIAFMELLHFCHSLHLSPEVQSAVNTRLFSLYRMCAMIWSELPEKEKQALAFPEEGAYSFMFDLLIRGQESEINKELLFARENYQSVIHSKSYQIGRIITAIPRKIRALF